MELYSGGSLRTFGGIKGSAFCLVNETWRLLLSSNNPINKNYLDGNSCLIICIKRRLFNFNDTFSSQFLRLKNKNLKSKLAQSDNAYLPGELEEKLLDSRKRNIL